MRCILNKNVKTILARLEEVKLGETLEDGVNLGQVAKVIDKIGVKILDQKGELRDIGTVVEEIGNKWDTLSKAQQNAVAIVMAGKRQYNNLLALFDNWDMYLNLVDVSANSLGTLQQQHEIYLESITAYEHKLTAELQSLYSNVVDEDAIINVTKTLTKLVEILNKVIDGLGGIHQIMPLITAAMVSAFSPQIANGLYSAIGKISNQFKDIKERAIELRNTLKGISPETTLNARLEQQTNSLRQENYKDFANRNINLSEYDRRNALIAESVERERVLTNLQREQRALIQVANNEQRNSLNYHNQEITELKAKLQYYEQIRLIHQQTLSSTLGSVITNNNPAFRDQLLTIQSGLTDSSAGGVKYLQQGIVLNNNLLDIINRQGNSQRMNLETLRAQVNQWGRQGLASAEAVDDLNKIIDKSTSLRDVAQRLRQTNAENSDLVKLQRQELERQVANNANLSAQEKQILIDRINSTLELQEAEMAQRNLTRFTREQEESLRRITQQLEQQRRIQIAVKSVTAIAIGLSELGRAMETFANAEATAEDKANSLFHGVANGINTIGFMFGGMLGGSIAIFATSMVKAGLKVTGVYDKLVESLKSAHERIKELTDEIHSFSEEADSLSEQLDEVAEKLSRINELRIKSASGSITIEEKEELDILTQQEGVLERQKELYELKLELAKANAKEALKEIENQEYDFKEVTVRGISSDESQLFSLSGNIDEVTNNIILAHQKLVEYEQEAVDLINSGASFKDLDIRLQGVIRAYKNTLNKEMQGVVSQWEKGEITYEDSKELRSILQDLDPSKYGYFAEAKEAIEKAAKQVSDDREKIVDAIAVIDINGPEYKEAIEGSLRLAKSLQDQAEYVSRIGEVALKGLNQDELTPLSDFVSKDSINEINELSNALKQLEQGKEASEVLEELKLKGIDVGDSLADLKDNILSSASSISGNLYQSLVQMAAQGEISIEVFKELSDTLEILTDISGSSEIYNKTGTILEAYQNLLDADSDIKVQQAGSVIERWEVVAEADLEAQLNFIRKAYEQEHQIEKFAQYQQLQSTKNYLDELLSQAAELNEQYNQAIVSGDEELANSIVLQYEDIISKISQVTEEATNNYNDYIDNITTTYANYQTAIEGIYNEGDLLSANEAWFFLKDLPDYEEYFYKGSYEILKTLIEQQETVNDAIFQRIESYNSQISNIQDKIKQINNQKIQFQVNDNELKDEIEYYEEQIEELKDKIEDEEINLHINFNIEEEVNKAELWGDTLNNLYDLIHDNEDTPLIRLDTDDLFQIANIYPQLLADHAEYVDGIMYLDRQAVDNFILGEKQKLQEYVQNKIEILQADIKVLESQKQILETGLANNTLTLEQINKARAVAAEYELELQEEQRNSLQDTDTTGEKVAQDLGANFDSAGDLASKAIASMVSSSIANLQSLGKEARAVSEQIANMEVPSYTPGAYNVSSTYQRQGKVDTQNTAKDIDKLSKGVLPQTPDKRLLEIDRLGKIALDEVNKQIALKYAAIGSLQNSYLNIGQSGTKKSGSGSSSKAKEKELQQLEYEEDLYHYINQELDREEKLLKIVQKRKDTLYGSDYLKALEDEQNLLKSINKLTEIKYDMMTDDLASERAMLSERYGATFDENGLLINYNALLAKKAEEVNRLAEDSTNEEAYKKAKEEYEEMEKLLDHYLDILKESYDLEQDIIDKQIKIMENNLDSIIKTIEFDLQPTKDTINYLDFLNSFYKNDFYQSGENLTRLNQKYLETADSLDIYREGIESLKDAYAAGEISAADFNEEVRNQRDELQEALLTLSEIEEEMRNAYKDALDEAEDQLSDYTEILEHYNDEMGHFIKIINLIGEGHEYGTISDIYGSQSNNYMEQLRVQQKWYDNLLAQKKLLKETGQEGTDAWREVINALEDVEDNIYSLAENALEALKNSYTNLIDDVVNRLDKELTNGSKIQNMLTQYERDRDLGDMFLDKPTQLYEIDSLQKDIEKTMENITDKLQKEQLDGLYEELEVMRKKDKISEYDIERMKARFELLQAQAAFEDAQNAKNTMRLTRTSQGTWEYTFTADKSEVDDAANKVTDAYNNLYQMSKEHMQNLEQQILDTTSEYEDALQQMYKDWANGKYESEEEFYAQRDSLTQYYEQKLTDLTYLYNQARTDNALDAEDLILNTSKETGDALIQQIQDNKDQFNEAVADMADRIGGEGEDSFRTISNITLEELDEAWKNYNDNIADIKNEVSINLEDMQDKTLDLENQSKDLADTLMYEMVPALQSEIEEVIRVTAAHREEAAALREKIQAYLEYLSLLNQNINSSGSAGSGDFDMDTDWAREALLAAAAGDQAAMNQAVANRLNKLDKLGEEYDRDKEIASFDRYFQSIQQGNKELADAIKKLYASGAGYTTDTAKELEKYLPKFDTGGYTGRGGLAILHEKELVLNQDDTENMLDLMAITRNLINSTLGYNRNPIEFSSPTIGNLFPNSNNHNQNVYIEASFPNANDKNEIEAALINIINDASQYVNRKR